MRRDEGLEINCSKPDFSQGCRNTANTYFLLDCWVLDLQFCRDVPPGHMRAIDCLEMNRYEPDFTQGCRDVLEASIAERSADFRLDSSLRAACKKDIKRRCMKSATRCAHIRRTVRR